MALKMFINDENDVIVPTVVTAPTGLHRTKQAVHPNTDKDQFNEAMTFFKKLIDTMSVLPKPNFIQKMNFFQEIHSLIKNDKPLQIMRTNDASAESLPSSSKVLLNPGSTAVEAPPSLAIEGASADEEQTLLCSTEKKDLPHSWTSLHLPAAPKTRGRPRKNAGYFSSYHTHKKRPRVDQEITELQNMILDEEAEILQTEEMFIEDEFVEESVLHTEASSSIASSHDVVVLPNEGLSLTACRPTRDRSAQPMLFLDKVEPLTKTNQLSSRYINRAMEILKTQYPDIGGLFCCTLGGTLEYPQATGRQ
ncbi:hypothetical protein OUZ56_006095 [Daphnia magna]|uniref:BESS domain-containing protein n=1 Tax=Daphnia magna TaxID=35525 RepID=A0ABQ9YUL1_9CRUS|nr:hypothetical protein OUZ56_006095 [Daphnia magna]